MDGYSIACARRCGGNFRQRHHNVSALRHCSGFDDCELARIARRVGASAAETIRLLGLSRLFDSVAERAGVAVEADRFLAITGMERSFACSRSAARVGYGGCDRIYFRIPRGRLYPGLSHHCVSGLDKGLEL